MERTHRQDYLTKTIGNTGIPRPVGLPLKKHNAAVRAALLWLKGQELARILTSK